MGSTWHVATVGERVRDLRKALGLTHEQCGDIPRTEMSKIENGKNQLTTHDKRRQLASAFGLPREAFDAYIDGEADLQATLQRRGERERVVDDETMPAALDRVLQLPEAKKWAAETVASLRGAATASTQPRNEEQWLTFGRLVEAGVLATSRVVHDDPVAAKRAAKKAARAGER